MVMNCRASAMALGRITGEHTMKHTPTPWQLERIASENGMGYTLFIIPQDNSEDWIAKMAGHGSCNADAALICHRINHFDGLVEALENIISRYDDPDRGVRFIDMEKARAALKLAKP